MRDIATAISLGRQSAGAVAWGLFLILAPLTVVFLGAVIWVPLFIWRERRRALRYGFFPGAVWRVGIIASIVTAGVYAPLKHEDRRVGPLPRTSVTVADLEAAGVIYRVGDRQYETLLVSLPSTRPTRREVMDAIRSQTGLSASVFHCGVGARILFGSGGGLISVHRRPIPKA